MKYTTWLKIAALLQLLTALAHSLSFINRPVASNDTEKTLMDLMSGYKMDMGAGYARSMNDIFMTVSAGFTLLYLFAALLNWYLLRSKMDAGIMRGVIIINTGIFGISFAVMLRYAFLPPIVMTGLVAVSLFFALLSIGKAEAGN